MALFVFYLIFLGKKVFFIYEAPTPGQITMQYVKKVGFLCFKCNFFTSTIKEV